MVVGEQRYTFDRVVRLLLSTIGIVAFVLLLRYLSDVLIPFAAAVVLAYLINPLVNLFERKIGRRGPALALTLTSLTIFGLAVLMLLVPLMASQARRFRDSVMKLREDVASAGHASAEDSSGSGAPSAEPAGVETGEPEASIPVTPHKSQWGWQELKGGWNRYRRDAGEISRVERLKQLRRDVSGTYVGDMLEEAIRYSRSDEFNQLLMNMAAGLAIGGWTVVTWGLNLLLGLTGLVIVLVYLIFLLLDYPEYERTWKSFLPPNYRAPIVDFLVQFNTVLRRYFRGQSVVALLTGALMSLGFTIIGLPMAVPLGLFVGLLNMVPYLQAVAFLPAVFLAALRAIEGDSGFLMSVVLTFSVFVVVQIIQDTVIVPRVIGKAVGLRPVAILLGLFIWGKLLGFLGVLLAIPLTCLGIAYYRRYVLKIQTARTAPVDSA